MAAVRRGDPLRPVRTSRDPGGLAGGDRLRARLDCLLDLWQGNTIWSGEALTGLVDWEPAGRGPPQARVTAPNMVRRMELSELAAELRDPAVRGLLSLAVWPGTKIEAVVTWYATTPGSRLLGFRFDGRPVAIIGLELGHEGGPATIRHLAVAPSRQRHGLGRALVQAVCDQFEPPLLRAETDRDAVGFYERIGFSISSLGERYPGRERFECLLDCGAGCR